MTRTVFIFSVNWIIVAVQLGFPCGSAGKETACNGGRLGFNPWVGKIPRRREQLPTLLFWPGEFHGLYSPWCHEELDTTEQLSLYLDFLTMSHLVIIVFSGFLSMGGSDLSMETPPKFDTFLAFWFKLVSVCWSFILRCCLSHGSRVHCPHRRPRLVSLCSASAGTSQGVGSYRAVPRGRGGGSIRNQHLDWIHSNLRGFGNPCVWSTALSAGL